MKRSKASSLAAVALALSAASSIPSTANAFVPSQGQGCSSSATSLYVAAGGDDHAEASRRDVLRTSMGALFGGLAAGTALVGRPEAASASYSAYTNREKDWEARSKTGDIKVSSARDLRNQLRDIVPQNSEGSKIFCPNGPSSAVSPLMENKCGDRQATASVFGRTQDTVGNSIPGFDGGKYPGVGGGSSTLSAAEAGGFLSYGDIGATSGKANSKLISR